MKRTFLLLALFASLPFQSWGIFGVADTSITIADVQMPIHLGNFGLLTAINAQMLGLNGLNVFNNTMAYMNMYQNNGMIGSALAAIPGNPMTSAAANTKQFQKITEAVEVNEMIREALVQEATVIDLSPRELFQKISQGMGGDWVGLLRKEAQKKFKEIKEKMVDQFTKEKLAEVAAGFVEDILSCKTPQLDAIYPSIDLDMSLAMCDYKQMFSDMKDQVSQITDRKWGDSFTLNGRPINEIIKDPDALKEAVQMVPPSMGRKLTLDFLSDASVKASMQATVDATAIGQQMAAIISPAKRAFSSRNLMDAIDDLIQIQIKGAQLQSVHAKAASEQRVIDNQMQKMKENEEIEETIEEDVQETIDNVMDSIDQ